MTSADSFDSKLDALYDKWQKLPTDSSDSALESFASHFSTNATAWLLSMRELADPSIGREGIIEGIKKALSDSQITERRVVARSVTPDGRKVFIETSNAVTVHGKLIDPLPETTVVEFDDKGLIVDFKIYSCRSPIVALIQDATGEGPYERHDAEHCT